jgi:hypothetical protein
VFVCFTGTSSIEPARHGMFAVSGHFEFRRFWVWDWEGLKD